VDEARRSGVGGQEIVAAIYRPWPPGIPEPHPRPGRHSAEVVLCLLVLKHIAQLS